MWDVADAAGEGAGWPQRGCGCLRQGVPHSAAVSSDAAEQPHHFSSIEAVTWVPLSIDGMVVTFSLVLPRWAGDGVRAVAGQGRACAGRKHGQLGPVFAGY